MKRGKIFATIITLCLAISILAYGVYAATNLSFTVGANIAFVVDNLFVDIDARIIGAYENGTAYNPDQDWTRIWTNNPNVSLTTESLAEYIEDKGIDLNFDSLTFNPNYLTPITIEVRVRNYTPNKGVLVTIGETSSIIAGGDGSMYNVTKTCKTGLCSPLKGDNGIEETQDIANWTYTLDSLTQKMDIRFDWQVNIDGIELTYDDGFCIDETFGGSRAAIDGTITAVENYVFPTCVESSNKYYMIYSCCLDYVEIEGDTTISTITFPNSVGDINWEGNNSTRLILPKSLIEASGIYNSPVTIPADSCYLKLKNGNIYSKDEMAFLKCLDTSQTDLTGVKDIGHYAFYNASISSITIPDSVKTIGSAAFSGCTSLSSIIIGNSVEEIGSNAFNDTAYYKDNSKWQNNVLYLTSRNESVLYLLEAKRTISGAYDILENTKVIASSAFYACSSLTSITIPNGIKKIDGGTFCSCSSLASITMPNSILSIGCIAFDHCTSLTSITIPYSVKSIEERAFFCSGCTEMELIFADPSNWYKTNSEANWKNKIGGTLVDLSDSAQNATWLRAGDSNGYVDYYWYKL